MTHRFSGKGLEQRIKKLKTQKNKGLVIYQWVRQDRISAQDLDKIMNALLESGDPEGTRTPTP